MYVTTKLVVAKDIVSGVSLLFDHMMDLDSNVGLPE